MKFSAVLLLSALAFAGDVRITPEDQKEEAQWLASLGIKPPATPWPLEDPFAMPFTRRSLIVPTAWYRQKRPQTLRADLFREDIKLLHKIMEIAYGGWETAQRRGWNWDAFFREWDAQLAARGNDDLPIADAFAPWRKFMEVQLDNHSGPLAGGFATVGHAFSWTSVLEREPAGNCTEFRNPKGAAYSIDAADPAQKPKQREDAAGRPVFYIVTTSAKGPVASVRCGSDWIAAHPAWMPEEDERAPNIRLMAQTEKDVPVFRSISPRIAYIRFPSFSKPAVELTITAGKVTPRPQGQRSAAHRRPARQRRRRHAASGARSLGQGAGARGEAAHRSVVSLSGSTLGLHPGQRRESEAADRPRAAAEPPAFVGFAVPRRCARLPG